MPMDWSPTDRAIEGMSRMPRWGNRMNDLERLCSHTDIADAYACDVCNPRQPRDHPDDFISCQMCGNSWYRKYERSGESPHRYGCTGPTSVMRHRPGTSHLARVPDGYSLDSRERYPMSQTGYWPYPYGQTSPPVQPYNGTTWDRYPHPASWNSPSQDIPEYITSKERRILEEKKFQYATALGPPIPPSPLQKDDPDIADFERATPDELDAWVAQQRANYPEKIPTPSWVAGMTQNIPVWVWVLTILNLTALTANLVTGNSLIVNLLGLLLHATKSAESMAFSDDPIKNLAISVALTATSGLVLTSSIAYVLIPVIMFLLGFGG